MSPYRETALALTEPRSKHRHWLWRLHLWVRGTWRSRFIRCKECGKVLRRDSPGEFLGPVVSHQIMHNARREGIRQAREQAAKAKEREDLALIAEDIRRRRALEES